MLARTLRRVTLTLVASLITFGTVGCSDRESEIADRNAELSAQAEAQRALEQRETSMAQSERDRSLSAFYDGEAASDDADGDDGLSPEDASPEDTSPVDPSGTDWDDPDLDFNDKSQAGSDDDPGDVAFRSGEV